MVHTTSHQKDLPIPCTVAPKLCSNSSELTRASGKERGQVACRYKQGRMPTISPNRAGKANSHWKTNWPSCSLPTVEGPTCPAKRRTWTGSTASHSYLMDTHKCPQQSNQSCLRNWKLTNCEMVKQIPLAHSKANINKTPNLS